ncbi:hypothetical protein [Haloplasma contractile]|uniref:Membrane protein putative n=1 Tax=Haloplasma contractile SSD-17B TaxID=1033810 RepID=F7Q0J7_9MOLU|nr:hypothetical protein [Haloplasma contractile]ERJ12658.1 Membrane protein putative [Haloplasma contractile SSD-17B]
MKLKDLLWLFIIVVFALLLIIKDTREQFVYLTKTYPYIMGFIKTAILATMGEVLAKRIRTGTYSISRLTFYKFIVWGFLGLAFVVVFKLFYGGITFATDEGLLPKGGTFLHALLTSTFMNLIFAPTFMALHRVTDSYIDLGEGKLGKILKVKIDTVIAHIDWQVFIKFVVLKTIPFFWIPAHTITFLLPDVYRVLMAASLSIALGIILSFKGKR